MKKKILFMVSSMNIGGVEKSLISLLNAIPKEKYEINILTLEKKGGFLNEIPSYINVHEAKWYREINHVIMDAPQKTVKIYLENGEYYKSINFCIAYLYSKYFKNRNVLLKNIFKNTQCCEEIYDVAIAYAGPTEIIDYYIANKVKANKKISWVHFDISKHIINSKLYSKIYSKVNKIFTVSKEAKGQLELAIPNIEDKTEIFYNVISKQMIREMSNQKEEFYGEFKGFKIVTVGRLSKEKGQDIAINVMHKLKEDGFNIRWYCIGEGRDRLYYENLISKLGLEKDFILLGSKLNPYTFINQADLYVQPSRHEGYCLTLAEAKCLNKPIVTTDFTGAREQIKHNYNGLICKCNEEDLYEKILLLYKDLNKRKEIVKNLSMDRIGKTNNVEKLFQFID
ncbi:MAG: glycosyltransferase [Clostridium sp.]|uniref:glycosyltransferase n=1 Tax=Clostridium sp. TaxID=1506 RepID=UPI002FC9AAC4